MKVRRFPTLGNLEGAVGLRVAPNAGVRMRRAGWHLLLPFLYATFVASLAPAAGLPPPPPSDMEAAAERRSAHARAQYELKRAAAHERMRQASGGTSAAAGAHAARPGAAHPHQAWLGANADKPAVAAPASAAAEQTQLEHHLPFFPSAARTAGTGFVRVVNRSGEAGEVAIVAIDDAGQRFGPVSLAIGGHAAVHLDAADLQFGNAAKGLARGVGLPTQGDWRLVLESPLDIRALAYWRSADGALASLHDRLAKHGGVRRVALFNAADSEQASRLRLINESDRAATVTIRGIDDSGALGAAEVIATMPPGAAHTFSAVDLERGSDAAEGALGDGDGAWRLTLAADQPIRAVHLLAGAGGPATWASPAAPQRNDEGLARHHIPYFPTESAAGGGGLRFSNDSGLAGTVDVYAFDRTGKALGPAAWSIGPWEAGQLGSADLRRGNPAKGLPTGIGDGAGPLRLVLATTLPGRASAYFRSTGGRLAGLAPAAGDAGEDGRHRVFIPLFGTGEDANHESLLHLVNWQAEDAAVTIAGRDDRGTPSGAVRLTVPATSARTLTSRQLESGDAEGLRGALGQSNGHWRLDVSSAVGLQALSLRASDGRIANFSSVPPPEDVSAAGIFAEHISAIVQRQCVQCHVAGGQAAGARLRFTPAAVADDHEALNLQAIRSFLAEVEDGAALLLNRIQGVGHGGGVQLPASAEDHVHLARLLRRLGEAPPEPPAAATLFAGVQFETPRSTLRRAALTFAGRMPTAAEYAAVEAGGGAALRRAVRGLMAGPAFHDFLLRASNDRLLTDRELTREPVIGNDGFFVNYDNEHVRRQLAGGPDAWAWHHRVQYGAARAPLELIAQVVENDLPYTAILTADYIMANPSAAWVYGDDVAFDDPDDPHEFRPSAIKRYYRHGPGYVPEYLPGVGLRVVETGPLSTIYPHAGLLNAKAFLQRYPTTATNRNRARARWTYYHFLGVDIEKSASRTTDPAALADTNNPTLNNPACTVCHGRLDPVAGAFQNYGDSGYYRDKWGGLDALDYFYKNAASQAQAIRGDSFARASRLSWPLRLPAGESTLGFTYTNDFYDEETNTDGAIFLDYWRVLDGRGREVARHEFETEAPIAPWGSCGEKHWNPATAWHDHLRLWHGGHECAVHLSLALAEAGEYTAEVVAWGPRHDRYGAEGYPQVSVAVDPYRTGDTWYRTMRAPGFAGEALPERDDSLGWLARRIVADERFATAAVRFWWPAVMGREVVEPPATAQDSQLPGRLLAANAQQAEVQRLAAGFRHGFAGGKAHNAKDLLAELVLSKWFRAEAVDNPNTAQAEALREAGARRLLTPEELSRKTAAITGFEWGRWRHPAEQPHRQRMAKLTDANQYRLLYGGIDSAGITARARDMTAVMAGVAQAHAVQASCPVILRELYALPKNERRLFGGIEAAVSPRFELSRSFAIEESAAAYALRGALTPGRKTVWLKFPNDRYTPAGDRNLYLDRSRGLVVTDEAGAVVQTVPLDANAAVDVEPSNCNRAQGGRFSFYCRGWLALPLDLPTAGVYSLEVVAWGDLHGDELPRLEVVVDADAPTPVGVAAIKRQLARLHEALLGLAIEPEADEIAHAYQLFEAVWQRQRKGSEPWFLSGQACHWWDDIRFFDGIVSGAVGERDGEYGPYHTWDHARLDAFWSSGDFSDPHFAARTWVVVLAYLLMDYRYLHL